MFTTKDVARKIGVTRGSVYNWIRLGRIVPPKQVPFGKRVRRWWSTADIERVRAVNAAYVPRRGRPKASKNRPK